MSETATYRQSTFNSTEQKLEQFEQQAAAPELQPEASATTVNSDGALDIVQPEAGTQPEVQAEPMVQEENVSSFDLGGESQTDIATEQGQAQLSSFDWRSELKKLDKKEVAKELGFHDFTLEMDEYLAKGGVASDYINARGYDWNKVSDEELVKRDLRKQFEGASDTQIERLYNKKYNQRYEDTDEDREDGILLMKSEGRRLRELEISKQNSFKIPEAIIPQIKDEAYEQWKHQQEAQPAMMQKLNEFYQNHEATKTLNDSKRVAVNLGDGVPSFNFIVNNPDAITRMYTDGGETWQRLTSTQSGEPDVPKQQLIGLISHNPQKFIQDIFNYGIQMGKKRLVEEGHNAQKPQQKVMPSEFNQPSYGIGKFGDKARS
jgi:hypothetical protein